MQNLLLAAGLGTRSKGEKLLLPYQGETLVHRAVSQSLLAGLYTVVVTGFRAAEVQAAIEDLCCDNLLVVHNPDYEQGQGSSTWCGAHHLKEHEDFFISLADMPLIEKRHYRYLASQSFVLAARPCLGTRLGHPVLLKSTFLPIIRDQKGPFTMRSLLKGYDVECLSVEDEAYVLDIDTLSDYADLISSGRPPLSPPSQDGWSNQD